MMTLLSLVFFLLLLGLVVAVHEGGHLLACLALHIPLLEVGIGLPPRLLRLGRRGATEVTLNALPLGAFVRPAGDFDPLVPDGLASRMGWQRLLVYVSGAAANVLLALFLLTLGFRIGWPDEVRIVDTPSGSPAELAGLRAGDVILAADGTPVHDAETLSGRIEAVRGGVMVLQIRRGEEILDLSVEARLSPPAGEGPIGFTSQGTLVSYPVGAAFVRAAETVGEMARSTVAAIGALLGFDSGSVGEVRIVGPLGMKQISDRALANAVAWGEGFPLVYLAAWLSASLGLFNLLPFPALDGGRAAFLLIEFVRRKRVPARIEARVHAAGMVVLLTAMLALVALDLLRPPF
jgi:regulator of sigma E protease